MLILILLFSNSNDQPLKVKETTEAKKEFSQIDTNVKAPSIVKDTVVAVGSKDVRSFPKEEGCRLNLSKVQEIPKLQEPVQQLAETLQRHCHKRLRGKTVTGGESSNSSSLSLLRPNTPGELALLLSYHP